MLDFAKDKAFWENVRTSDDYAWHRQEIKELYDKAFKTPPRAHSAKDILEANDNGLWRLQFDHLQTSCALALIYPDNKEYYDNLVDTIWAYLNEYTWAPLGHYTEYYYGRTPKDFDYGLIDIFAGSVAFALAEIKNLFADRFPKLLTDRISYELRRRTIEPYLERRFFWEKHDNNWTAVCAGSVGGVLMYEAPELFFENQKRLHSAMESYLASYKDDGMCVEGVGYWAFGFGFFASYAMLEREITNGEVDWFARPKVKEIAKYLQKTFLQKDVLVTYGDCSVKQNYQPGLPHMLKAVYGDEIESLPKEPAYIASDNTHFNFLLRALLYHKNENYSDTLNNNVTYTNEGSNYFVKRTGSYGFTTKGGNNGESHNHIDVGTFIIARNNKQIICDIGAGPYEDGYHSDRRYTFFHPSAYSHNMPLFDGVGEDNIRRNDVIVHYDKDRDMAYMDIAIAYGKPFVKKLERSFSFKENSITLTDKFELTEDKEITERFISLIEPSVRGNSLAIDDVVLEVCGNIIPKITTKEVTAHMSNVGKHNVYIIEYTLPREQKEFTIEFKMP